MLKNNFLPSNHQDLQVFAEAQFNTIMDLNKQIIKLKSENEVLKKVNAPTPVSESSLTELMIPNETAICEIEIKRLREKTLEGPLTYEESKKLQIYVELILKIENKPRTIEITRKMKDEDLLALVDDTNK